MTHAHAHADFCLTEGHRHDEGRKMDHQAVFRAAMACFASGVTVVTTAHERERRGATVSAFCSVSLDPPLVLVSLRLGSRTLALIEQSGVYAVNVLTAEQRTLAARFAGSDPAGKSFADLPHHLGVTGAPLLDAALIRVECRVTASYIAGDHTLLLGEVMAIEGPDPEGVGAPLLVYRAALQSLQPPPSLI